MVVSKDLLSERLVELPMRLETATFFSPVVIVSPQVAVAINGVNFGGGQAAGALNLAGLGTSLG